MGSHSSFPRARALVLDNSEREASALSAALAEVGFLTDVASRPNTANALLQVAEQEGAPYEVLIVAEMVTGICGLDLAAALALRVRTRPTTFLSSGPFSAREAGELTRSRCSGVILKPLRLDQFHATLAAALSADRLRAIREGKAAGLLAL